MGVWVSVCVCVCVCVVGGNDGRRDLATVESFESASGSWRSEVPMPSKRRALTACVLDTRIYALGGYDGSSWLNTGIPIDIHTVDTGIIINIHNTGMIIDIYTVGIRWLQLAQHRYPNRYTHSGHHHN